MSWFLSAWRQAAFGFYLDLDSILCMEGPSSNGSCHGFFPRCSMIDMADIYIHTTVDGRIIQTLIHRATPLTPNINVIFLFGSFLQMDEINQTPRAGTALRNHITHGKGFE